VAKLAPSDLAQVLSKLPAQPSENVIVGLETSDGAGVFRLTDETALVQTVDFFTPVADYPDIYGQVAAINSLNDVYAMGGTPLTALSIVCYPQKGDWDVLRQILAGGQKAMNANGVVIIGGHSIDDPEMKFDYLRLISGVDWTDRLSSVYHLYSYTLGHGAVLRVDLDRTAPNVASVAGIWPTADWLERETYDLMGIVYEGHPGLTRIMLPDDWEGHPLRKDYVSPKEYHGIANE
jgi:NADH:ubiquinone oxidoreductase subunit C